MFGGSCTDRNISWYSRGLAVSHAPVLHRQSPTLNMTGKQEYRAPNGPLGGTRTPSLLASSTMSLQNIRFNAFGFNIFTQIRKS